MPRSLTPSRPFQVVKVRVANRFRYYILSDNSYVYHHSDKTWRIRKLNDCCTYCFRNKKVAATKCAAFNRVNFPQE